MIDLPPAQLKIVQTILAQYAPDCEVRAFGSRVRGTAKPYSDLDLVFIGRSRLPFKKISAIRTAFEESELLFRVDVLDWHALSPQFQQIILQANQLLQSGSQFAESVEVR
ncbi:MAG: nucleotidyltransferase domain-containing protein [Anaerolineales bacterium]